MKTKIYHQSGLEICFDPESSLEEQLSCLSKIELTHEEVVNAEIILSYLERGVSRKIISPVSIVVNHGSSLTGMAMKKKAAEIESMLALNFAAKTIVYNGVKISSAFNTLKKVLDA